MSGGYFGERRNIAGRFDVRWRCDHGVAGAHAGEGTKGQNGWVCRTFELPSAHRQQTQGNSLRALTFAERSSRGPIRSGWGCSTVGGGLQYASRYTGRRRSFQTRGIFGSSVSRTGRSILQGWLIQARVAKTSRHFTKLSDRSELLSAMILPERLANRAKPPILTR